MVTLLIVTLIVIVLVIKRYNTIVANYNAVERAWANVITQERQKNKVIPHLEELTNQYKNFEHGILKQVTELRAAIEELDESSMNTTSLSRAEAKTRDLVSGLKVTVENYPELKASDIYSNLMKEISEQQENIGASIRVFNQNVEVFNNGIEFFPDSIINSMLNRKKKIDTFKDSEAESGFEYTPNLH